MSKGSDKAHALLGRIGYGGQPKPVVRQPNAEKASKIAPTKLTGFARGGATKHKAGTKVNVIVAPQQPQAAAQPPMPPPPPGPPPAPPGAPPGPPPQAARGGKLPQRAFGGPLGNQMAPAPMMAGAPAAMAGAGAPPMPRPAAPVPPAGTAGGMQTAASPAVNVPQPPPMGSGFHMPPGGMPPMAGTPQAATSMGAPQMNAIQARAPMGVGNQMAPMGPRPFKKGGAVKLTAGAGSALGRKEIAKKQK